MFYKHHIGALAGGCSIHLWWSCPLRHQQVDVLRRVLSIFSGRQFLVNPGTTRAIQVCDAVSLRSPAIGVKIHLWPLSMLFRIYTFYSFKINMDNFLYFSESETSWWKNWWTKLGIFSGCTAMWRETWKANLKCDKYPNIMKCSNIYVPIDFNDGT